MWSGLTSRAKRRRPTVPTGVRVYAIGDVHGRFDLLQQVQARIDTDLLKHPASTATEVYLGDYIDRGPESRQVIDCLISRAKTRRTVFLKGNHETYVSAFIAKPTILNEWRQFGGIETLLSYGLQPSMNTNEVEQIELSQAFGYMLPTTHKEFLGRLQLSMTCGDFFFVHAGVKPHIPLDQQREEDLLWIRDDFLLYEDDFEKIVVHGHTPVRDPDIRPNRINIDTGAYATGRLTCIAIENDSIAVVWS